MISVYLSFNWDYLSTAHQLLNLLSNFVLHREVHNLTTVIWLLFILMLTIAFIAYGLAIFYERIIYSAYCHRLAHIESLTTVCWLFIYFMI